jgi:mRNA interferase YafQ
MPALEPTKSFKRDVQLIASKRCDIMKLFPPLFMLMNKQPLPRQYNNHPLKGEWVGHREFHAAPDWVVIYRIEANSPVPVRTGSHDFQVRHI